MKRKQVTIDERRKVGSLRDNLVSVHTKKLYRKACVWFFQICERFQWTLPQEYLEFDELVSDAIEYAWGEGEGRSLAGNLLSGLEKQRALAERCFEGKLEVMAAMGQAGDSEQSATVKSNRNVGDQFLVARVGFPRSGYRHIVGVSPLSENRRIHGDSIVSCVV